MKPYGMTIFCDDIRDEVSGKKTYVGVYLNDILIPGSFPGLIPSFGFAISYYEPISFPKNEISIKVFVPDKDGKDAVLLDAIISQDRPEVEAKLSDGTPAEFRVHLGCFKVSPLLLPREGRIKVRAFSGTTETKLGTIGVRAANAEEMTKLGWSETRSISAKPKT